jgi:hypothetical protein
MLIRTKVIGQNPLAMAAILESKMADNRYSYQLNYDIFELPGIDNMGFATKFDFI